MTLWLAEQQKPIFIYMLVLNVKLMSYKSTLLLGDKDQVFKRQSNKFSLQRLRSGISHGLCLLLWTSESKQEQSDKDEHLDTWKLTCVYKIVNSLPFVGVYYFLYNLVIMLGGTAKVKEKLSLRSTIHIFLLSVLLAQVSWVSQHTINNMYFASRRSTALCKFPY